MDTYLICPDCAMWAANHDDSGADRGWKQFTNREYVSGFVVSDEYHDFSSAQCAGCDDYRAGVRFEAVRFS